MSMARTVEVVPPAGGRAPRPAAPRRTKVVVRRVGPWSVLRFSLFFYFCMMLAGWVGLFIVYKFLGSIGVLHSFEDFMRKLSGGNTHWENWSFHTGWIFSRLFMIGLVMVVFGSIVNLIGAFLYNLLAEFLGGIELTLAERK